MNKFILTTEELMDALESVVNYNGMLETLQGWKEIPIDEYGYIQRDFGMEDWGDHQLEVFWMMAVVLFGEYGTSPRYGWIEKHEEFYRWIDEICYSWAKNPSEMAKLAKLLEDYEVERCEWKDLECRWNLMKKNHPDAEPNEEWLKVFIEKYARWLEKKAPD